MLPRTVLVTALLIIGCSSEEPLKPLLTTDARSVTHGQELAYGVASCAFCHTPNGKPKEQLIGGRVVFDRFGEVVTPNLTAAGLVGWSEGDIIKLLRTYERPDGTRISSDVHRGYEWLSDADASGIAAYLRALPGVGPKRDQRDLSFIAKNTAGLFEPQPAVNGYVPGIPKRFVREYGQYVADNVARCGGCHNSDPGLMGSEEYWKGGKLIRIGSVEGVAPNITQSRAIGIGDWADAGILAFLTRGTTPTGKAVDSRLCPVGFFRFGTPEDLKSLVSYIRSVPAVE